MGLLSRYMRNSLANKLRKIATAEGLSFAIAWGGVIQNSAVQLICLDSPRLEDLRKLLAPVVKKLKKSFGRANEISFIDSETSWPFKVKSVKLDDGSDMAKLGFSFKSWTHSGIGNGLGLTVDFAQKQVTTMAQEHEHEQQQEEEEEDAAADDDDDDEGGDDDDDDDDDDDEMTLADLARARDSRRAGARAPAEQQARATARKRKRGERDGSGSGSEESASSDGVGSEQSSGGASAAESTARRARTLHPFVK
jgi:hypothetical protein